jgi:hypothetical protein
MKTIFRLFLLILFSAGILSSCGVHHNHATKSHKAPPGQVKKHTGSKSAKPYAPGQNKKKKKYKDLP